MEYDVALQAKASDRRPFGVGRRKASAATLAATLCCLSLDGCAAGRTAVKIAASHTQVTPTTLAVTTTSKATQSRRQGRVSWGPSAGLTDVSCWGQTCVAGGSSTAMRTGDPVAARALYSTDAGAVWQIATLPSDLTDLDAADCVSVTRCLAIGQVSGGSTQQTRFVTTSNGGASWDEGPLPILGRAGGYSMACGSTSWCAVVAFTYSPPPRSEVLVTQDAGGSWTAAKLPLAALSVSCSADGSCLASALGSESVMASVDFGRSWRVVWVAPPSLKLEVLGTVSCQSSSSCLLSAGAYVGVPYSQGVILYTRDGGLHSELAAGAPAESAAAMPGSSTCAGTEHCLATANLVPDRSGTDVFVSADGGERWSEVGSAGRPSNLDQRVNPVDAVVSCASATTCVAVAGNFPPNGVFIARTVDSGYRWRAVSLPPCALGRCQG
jgi:hypothetical protein